MLWLLWTSYQLVAEATTYTAHNRHNRTSMPWARFEPAVPATEQPQTYAFGRKNTGIGTTTCYLTQPPCVITSFLAGASCNSPDSTWLRIKLRSHPVPECGCPLWYTDCVTLISATNIWGNRHFKMDRGCMLSVVSTTTNITVEKWHSCGVLEAPSCNCRSETGSSELSSFTSVPPVIFWNIILNCSTGDSFHTFPGSVPTSNTDI